MPEIYQIPNPTPKILIAGEGKIAISSACCCLDCASIPGSVSCTISDAVFSGTCVSDNNAVSAQYFSGTINGVYTLTKSSGSWGMSQAIDIQAYTFFGGVCGTPEGLFTAGDIEIGMECSGSAITLSVSVGFPASPFGDVWGFEVAGTTGVIESSTPVSLTPSTYESALPIIIQLCSSATAQLSL